MEKEVGRDIANSIKLFQETFGKSAADHFYATDIPFTHGEAFPGLMHFSWQTFQMTSEKGADHIFRAHEAAHQWWGIGVDFKTYHDQWLSEGFSEYSGWWYWHEVDKKEEENEKKFYDLLKKKREQIVENRKFFLSDGQKSGPIWLGIPHPEQRYARRLPPDHLPKRRLGSPHVADDVSGSRNEYG